MNEDGAGDLKAHLSNATAGIGIIYDCQAVDAQLSPSESIPYNLVDISGLTPQGARVTHNQPIEKGVPIGFMTYGHKVRTWEFYRAVVERSTAISDPIDCFVYDLKFENQ